MAKLNLEIIDSFNMKKKIWTPDYDDRGYLYTLPCGIDISTLTLCCNEPTESDSLEGLDGYIYIDTKEELEKLVKMDIKEVFEYVKSTNEDFDIDKYIEDYL